VINFDIQNLFSFRIFGFEVWVTQTIVNTWIVMLIILAGALFLRFKLRQVTEVPQGVQNVAETLVEASDGLVFSMGGPKAKFAGAWIFMAFAFILVSNLSGMIGLRPPTADWATTLAMGLVTFILIQIAGITNRGAAYLKTFLKPVFLFLPINIIGELARPVSLSLRLFGNVVAGLIIMSLLYGLAPLFFQLGLPVFLHAYFDLFMGLLQTYVFCALSLAFIGSASAEE